MRNKRKKLFLCVLMAFLLIGCNAKEEQELLSADKKDFFYTVSEETQAYTVDEEGLLYTVRSDIPKPIAGDITQEEYAELYYAGRYDLLAPDKEFSIHTVEVYDTKGALVRQETVEFGNGIITMVTVKNGKLYCVASVDLEYWVYIIDSATWETELLAVLTDYKSFEQMVILENYLYVLGRTEEAKNYALYPGVFFVNNRGESICRINIEEDNPDVEVMKVDFPIGIYATEQNTLMIYQYTEEKGFSFLEFDPAEMSLTEHELTQTTLAMAAISSCGEGYLYVEGEKLFYGTIQGIRVQLLTENIYLLQPAVYQKGFVFLQDAYGNGTIKRICVADFIKDNKELRVLTDDSPNDFPYGCGYQMATQPATVDEFALKVLAQDSDFDLFVLDTRNDCAYNLKENGAFYALNNVDGVQEYLDACFPYIKELAYNEGGDIWMIPVDIDIPGLVYSREFCEKQGVDYSAMNYMEFMELVEKAEATEPEKLHITIGNMLETLLMQYVSKFDSFDTELFRNHLSKLKQIYDDATSWGSSSVYGSSLGNGVPTEFYMGYEYNSSWYKKMVANETAHWAYAPSYFPKLEEDIGNVGTITLLAVNPESDNLKETLKYITEYCNYMLTLQNSFILVDESTYTMDNPFVKDYYDMVAGGTIEFRMADEIYEDVFWDYLKGEISLEDAIAEAERKMKIYKGE